MKSKAAIASLVLAIVASTAAVAGIVVGIVLLVKKRRTG
jgi:hypothetical protein